MIPLGYWVLINLASIIFLTPLLLLFILNIIGFIQGIKSFKLDEQQVVKKYVGTIGNLIFIILFMMLLMAMFGLI